MRGSAQQNQSGDLWQAYQLAQQHYELDLQLFSTRMNLFLIIQSGLVAVNRLTADRTAVAVFGLLLAAGWVLVAVSSYMWVKTWRVRWVELGVRLSGEVRVEVASSLFRHDERQQAHKREYGTRHIAWKQLEHFSWLVRPTLVSCFLPLLFMIGWIYLGWLA